MRASLIIAAHNEGESLRKAIESCLETSGRLDHEIVVADDASTDGSVDDAQVRFPRLRVVRHDERRGAAPAKALGAAEARGETLVFLDGHTKPEPGAIERLVEDVELVGGTAIITPRIPALDVAAWRNSRSQVGSGYYLSLETFDCGWLAEGQLTAVERRGRRFFESPALIGCALAISRELYDRLWGFDAGMRYWGVEDLDFGLKCWLAGYSILHDPEAVVGHRFRAAFDNYTVPAEHVVANALRMAYKNFTQSVWSDWVSRARQRHGESLTDHPEGLWARAWELFQVDRASAEAERMCLHGRRQHDEFWYAERFRLGWPKLHVPATGASPSITIPALAALLASPSPPPCNLTGIAPTSMVTCVGVPVTFTAQGTDLATVSWSTFGPVPANPATGTGASFTTRWSVGSHYSVVATCADTNFSAAVVANAVARIVVDASNPEQADEGAICLGSSITLRALPSPGPFPGNEPKWLIVEQPNGSTLPTPGPGPTAAITPQVVGQYVISASCGESSKTFTLHALFVEFKLDRIIAGFTKDPEPLEIRVLVTVTVEGGAAPDAISFAPGGTHPERIEIENVQWFGGGFTMDVLGKSATPANRPGGDTTIEATLGTVVCASVPVVIVIPKSLVPVEADGPVTPINHAADATTSPAYFGPLAPGAVHLWTIYPQWLEITVNDQFGESLDAIYAGVQVTELAAKRRINQTMQSLGFYRDPVGSITHRPVPPSNNVAAGSPAAINWVTIDPVQPITPIDLVQVIPVQIGGHAMTPGIKDRRVIATTPDRVQIVWPST